MTKPFILQLYPLNQPNQSLEGLYLAHNVRQFALDNKPFVYSNYVTSIDGRIAIPDQAGDGQTVPSATANDRDWRLFQELAAQADILISSGRYLREWVQGNAQEILRVDDPQFADLRRWRQDKGLNPHPDIAILSRSLDFPIPDVLTQNGRRLVVFTSSQPNQSRVKAIESAGGSVHMVGNNAVDGQAMIQKMYELGYKVIYNTSGPKVMHLLLKGKVINRLYLTLANRILAGTPFSTIVEGSLLAQAAELKLNSIYFDSIGLDGLGQLFLSYEFV